MLLERDGESTENLTKSLGNLRRLKPRTQAFGYLRGPKNWFTIMPPGLFTVYSLKDPCPLMLEALHGTICI